MDHEKADQLLQAVGNALVDDPGLAEAEWDSVVLVGHLGAGATSIYAYRFVGTRAHSVALQDFDLYDLLPALRAAMIDERSGPWKAVLVQITKPDLDIHVEFEHEDANRWHMDGSDQAAIDAVIEEIRPG